MYALVRKRDLSVAVALTSEQVYAIRTVENGDGDEHLRSVVVGVMERAHAQGLWLGCDCRRDAGRRPVVAPCRSHLGNDYWRVLGTPQLEHDRECAFHRSHLRREFDRRWNREARQPPGGYIAVLRKEAAERRLAEGNEGLEGDRPRGAHARPALSRWLLRLLVEAGLHRVDTGNGFEHPGQWMGWIGTATRAHMVAPGRCLSQWWFPYAGDWQSKRVHAKLRAAAGDWPHGHRPQAFLSWVVSEAAADAVGREGQRTHVEVAKRVGRPTVGRNAVPGPYLFIGVVGLGGVRRGYECIEAYAQPIVARECPVPVDSHYERRAFGTLRATMKILEREFRGTAFRLEKPVFDVETPDGPCLPDFVITAARGEEKVQFVIEVMGFERAAYLKGKEVTHPRMETLGTLCTMQGAAFDGSDDGVTNEGRKVTRRIREVLRARWAR